MLTLFNRSMQEDFSQKLVEYAQGVLDVTGYNNALLASVSPAALDLPNDAKTRASGYYDNAVKNANNWIQKIARDCKVIPECIIGYDYLFKMNTDLLKIGLEELKTAPDNKEIKDSLDEILTTLKNDFGDYIKTAEDHIARIDGYYKNAKDDKDNFTRLLDDVSDAISLDEKIRDEIRRKIADAFAALSKAEFRLKEDELLLNNKAFIIISILTFGIPLIVTCMDKEEAEREINQQRQLINKYAKQLEDKIAAITALTLAQTSYQNLCTGIESLLSSSGAVVGVWKNLKNRFQAFADKIAEVNHDTDKIEIDQAIQAVNEMEENWKSLYSLSSALSKTEYETVVTSSNAA